MTSSAEWTRLESGALIHKDSRLFSEVEIGIHSVIEEFVVVGKPHRSVRVQDLVSRRGSAIVSDMKTVIGSRCYVQLGSIIYRGATLGDDVICTDYVTIGGGSKIGSGSKIHYRAQIFRDVIVGRNCRIGGFCCNDSNVGAGSSVYGSLLHRYGKHGGDVSDKAPQVGNQVVIAFNAAVIGGIVVGDKSYVAAGAIVTKDVPPNSVVTGVNGVSARSQWKGLGSDESLCF